MDLYSLIRNIPDWPQKGIIFRDITPLLQDAAGLRQAIEQMAAPFENKGIEIVAGTESRGFIFGAVIAQQLNAGFVPIRKPGKLPAKTVKQEYELEYGKDALEVHTDAVKKNQKVLMVDDLLATGGTMKASCELIEQLGGKISGISLLVELNFLNGRDKLAGFGQIHSVLKYD